MFFLSNVAYVVTRVMKMTDRWCLRLSAKGSGVTVEGSAFFPKEADTAPVADTKVAIDEDDDCGVDLFGEETEEEKAVKGYAVAVKASGKKKEWLEVQLCFNYKFSCKMFDKA
ncbi:hypothetical protein Hdeb2414_s0018g00516451 [Helianthus debilis subsp. tardiflorus]